MIDLQKLADRYSIAREKETVWFTHHDFESFLNYIKSHTIKWVVMAFFLGGLLSRFVFEK